MITFLVTPLTVFSGAAGSKRELRLRHSSAKGCPIRVSGYVSFTEDDSKPAPFNYKLIASAHNMTNKVILLFVVSFEAQGPQGPAYSSTYQGEHFFDADGFEPATTENVQTPPFVVGQTVVDGRPVLEGPFRPRAAVRVRFVEFADGSVWGDLDAAKETLSARQATVHELESLQRLYSASTKQEFLSEFSKPSLYLSIAALQEDCERKVSSPNCAWNGVQRMLDAAKRHSVARTLRP